MEPHRKRDTVGMDVEDRVQDVFRKSLTLKDSYKTLLVDRE